MELSNAFLMNAFNYVAIVLLLGNIGYLSGSLSMKKESRRIFLCLLLTLLGAAITDVISLHLAPYITNKDGLYYFRLIVDNLYFLFHTLTACCFPFYLLAYMGILTWRKKYVYWIFFTPILILEAMILINPFFGYCFSYVLKDGLYVYQRGILIYVLYVVTALYILGGFVLLILNRNSIDRQVRRNMLSLIGFAIFGIIIQFFFYNLQCELVCEAIATVGILFNMEDPYKFLEPVTKRMNREALMDDYHKLSYSKHRFYVIVLHFDNLPHYVKVISKEDRNTLLKQISKSLSVISDWYDIYYPGNAVFSIIVPEKPDVNIDKITDDLRNVFLKPFDFKGMTIKLSVSCYVVRVPDDVSSQETLLDFIDIEKDNHNDGFQVYQGSVLSQFKRNTEIEKAIRRAIKNNSILLYYQPIFSVKQNKAIACEALCRIHDDELGIIPPGEFIPVAEKEGLMHEMGEQIYRKSLQFIKNHSLESYGIEYVEVNLSVLQLFDKNLADTLDQITKEEGVDVRKINLEITESAAFSEDPYAKENISRLIKKGYSFSLDDFGSGYSNLGSLTKMRFKNIKFDISLLKSIYKDDPTKNLYLALVSALSQTGYQIIQEGVETREELDLVYMTDPNILIQGYYYGVPLPEDEFLKYLVDRSTL